MCSLGRSMRGLTNARSLPHFVLQSLGVQVLLGEGQSLGNQTLLSTPTGTYRSKIRRQSQRAQSQVDPEINWGIGAKLRAKGAWEGRLCLRHRSA